MNFQAGVKRAEVKKARQQKPVKNGMYNAPVNSFTFTGKR